MDTPKLLAACKRRRFFDAACCLLRWLIDAAAKAGDCRVIAGLADGHDPGPETS